jgi:hypothetical protein
MRQYYIRATAVAAAPHGAGWQTRHKITTLFVKKSDWAVSIFQLKLLDDTHTPQEDEHHDNRRNIAQAENHTGLNSQLEATAILACLIGETPYIAQTHCRAHRGRNSAKARCKSYTSTHTSLHFID